MSLMTVFAELFAFKCGSGVATHGIGDAGVSTEVVTGSFAVSGDGVPHAPRIGFAGIGNGVQDLASVTASGSADREPFTSGIRGT